MFDGRCSRGCVLYNCRIYIILAKHNMVLKAFVGKTICASHVVDKFSCEGNGVLFVNIRCTDGFQNAFPSYPKVVLISLQTSSFPRAILAISRGF